MNTTISLTFKQPVHYCVRFPAEQGMRIGQHQYRTGDYCPECPQLIPLELDPGEPETRSHPGYAPTVFCPRCHWNMLAGDEEFSPDMR